MHLSTQIGSSVHDENVIPQSLMSPTLGSKPEGAKHYCDMGQKHGGLPPIHIGAVEVSDGHASISAKDGRTLTISRGEDGKLHESSWIPSCASMSWPGAGNSLSGE